MYFSHLADQLVGTKNPLYVTLDEMRVAGAPIVDLVRGNVNVHGIVYPTDVLSEIFADALGPARVYHPDSFGQPVAREAIARYYGLPNLTSQQIVITPGTSVSYLYC